MNYPHSSFKPIKDKYHAKPNARELRFHLWLIENVPCVHSDMNAECVHHILQSHPAKRWRRDHEFVVPMTNEAHIALHAAGSERAFDSDKDYGELAIECHKLATEEGVL